MSESTETLPGRPSSAGDARRPGDGAEDISILGVRFLHVALPDGDELYVTDYGRRFLPDLMPENYWKDSEWFRRNSARLFGHEARSGGGSSTIYRVRTKPVHGRQRDIVLKWNRMGQDVPGAEESDEMLDAEFNSPYEEFSLVLEMREASRASRQRILTHKPLAVYVPARKVELWQSGRREDRMQQKMRRHTEVALHMFRPYAVIYEWVKGLDAAEAGRRGLLDEAAVRALTLAVEREMRAAGYVVRDRKPQHIIVRTGARQNLLRDRQGRLPWAVVDFELLERTPEREAIVMRARRQEYLRRQAHRFDAEKSAGLPPHLKAAPILGVHYIYGPSQSTGGALWVVGNDAALFDYFLPERWGKTPRTRLSVVDEIYHTVTKDNIHLVWKVSRVGQQADMDPFKPDEKRILDHGYNSPFEEIALSMELSSRGIPTTYPRAVCMTGHQSELSDELRDNRRYETHGAFLNPDGSPVLRPDRDYIMIWGYWNKPDDMLAVADGDYYQGIDALQAFRKGVLTEGVYFALMRRTRDRLAAIGIEDLNLRGNHLLLSLDSRGQLLVDPDGLPEVRVCNFELLRKLP